MSNKIDKISHTAVGSSMNKHRMLMLVLIAAAVCIAGTDVGAAAVITVDDSGSADFTSIQAAVDAASSGDKIEVRSGTYVENVDVGKRLTLIGDGADVVTVRAADSGDHVFDVTADWVNISGFTVTGGTCGYPYYVAGIYIYDAEHCNISDNNASDNWYGIHLNSSSNNMLQSNIANSNNGTGILLHYSSDNMLEDNTANSNDGVSSDGIDLHYSNNNTLLSNIANSNNGCGIWLYSSSSNMLTDNTANLNNYDGISIFLYSSINNLRNNAANLNSRNGIRLVDSSDNTLQSNTMSGNIHNFYVEGHYTQNIDTSNTVDEKPIYYWVNQHDKPIPDDAGFVGVVNSTNITVEDLTLTNNSHGVLFAYANDSKIENINTLNNEYGIFLWYSSNNTMQNNIVSNNRCGIMTFLLSNNNMLFNNTVNLNNEFGIFFWYSSNNTMQNNIVSNNGGGIALDQWSGNNTLTGNTASYNNIGIYLRSSNNDTLYHNNFIDNTQNAYYYSGTNTWDSGSEGNYWSDYTGNDTNRDGIGDIPYNISGGAGAQDRYPLMQPWNEGGSELISIGSVTTPPSSTVTIPVSVANVTNILGISFTLIYNSSVAIVTSVSANENFTGSSITQNIDNANGIASIVLTNLNLISASAETPVIDIAFNITGGSGSSTYLDLQNVEFSDAELNPYTPAVVVDGQIKVGIKGDFNDNGRVDIGDVAKVAFMVAGKVPEDLNADCNNNGRVDIGDAAKIAFYLAGKVSEL